MKVLSWNCRGAAKKVFPSLVKHLVRQYMVDIVFICEPRISGEKARRIIRKCGWDCFDVMDAAGFSGGLRLCWKQDKVSVQVVKKTAQMIHAKVELFDERKSFLFIAVYGSPRVGSREELWKDLIEIGESCDEPWVVGGDLTSI